MEMAMPARDMMFEFNPIKYIGIKESSTDTGIVTIGMIADGMCQRKIRITTLTMIISRISSSLRLLMEPSISSERSYVVTTFTPLGREGWSSWSLSFNAPDDFVGIFVVAHHDDAAHRVSSSIQVGDAASHLGSALNPGDVAQENRGAAVIGLTTICSMSCAFLMYPWPRTMYSAPENSTIRAPDSTLELRTASDTIIRGCCMRPAFPDPR